MDRAHKLLPHTQWQIDCRRKGFFDQHNREAKLKLDKNGTTFYSSRFLS